MSTKCKFKGQILSVRPSPEGPIALCIVDTDRTTHQVDIPVQHFDTGVEAGDEFVLSMQTAVGENEQVSYLAEVIGPALPEEVRTQLETEVEALFASVKDEWRSRK